MDSRDRRPGRDHAPAEVRPCIGPAPVRAALQAADASANRPHVRQLHHHQRFVQRAHLVFVNNRNRTFTGAAARYGIADTGFCTQAVWLDYDGDGDLDLFLLNNSPRDFQRALNVSPSGGHNSTPESYNRLYRNNGDGTFTDVSDQAGILRDVGYGLGVAGAALTGNGRPDIYVSNDITPNDVLYVNNGNGTFTDKAGAWLRHTSFAGMGVDIADFNNDGQPDILQVDMMPPALRDRKSTRLNSSHGYISYAVFCLKKKNKK